MGAEAAKKTPTGVLQDSGQTATFCLAGLPGAGAMAVVIPRDRE